MPDPSGAARAPQDLVAEVKAALQQATPGPWIRGARHGTYCTEIVTADGGREVAAVWNYADDFAPGEFRPTQKLSAQGEADFTLMQHAPDWLARLCARVRHLEAERDAATDLHDEAMLTLRETEDERDELRAEGHRLREKLLSSEAASQRLTEALRVIAEYNVGANHGAIDEWTESAAFHDCKKLAQVTLGAGAPPEGEK